MGYSFIHILNGCEVALCLLRTIFPSLTCAIERVRAQNVKDFPQTKLDCEIKAPFLLGDTRCFLQVFAKNSFKKNIFEKEKRSMVEHEFWFENSSALGVFGPIKSKPN